LQLSHSIVPQEKESPMIYRNEKEDTYASQTTAAAVIEASFTRKSVRQTQNQMSGNLSKRRPRTIWLTDWNLRKRQAAALALSEAAD
jgi:hypothetical protein